MELTIGHTLFTEQTCYTGEVMLNYVVGPNNGPPLLLIHGQAGSWETYRRVLEPLSTQFQVYAVDMRGHGKSSRTPGHYNWNTIGYDFRFFLKKIIQRKALVSGNYAGGLAALWLAAYVPEMVAGVILEDAPLFSAEMPRFREDKFVYKGLAHLVETMQDARGNPVNFLRTLSVPEYRDGRWHNRSLSPLRTLALVISVTMYRLFYRIDPIDLTVLPLAPRVMIKSLSMFDVDFARAFVEERIFEGLDHKEAIQITECPILVMHAKSFRHPLEGLVGAMDDDDASLAQRLNKRIVYKKFDVDHVVHLFSPQVFVNELKQFAGGVDFDGRVSSLTTNRSLQPVL